MSDVFDYDVFLCFASRDIEHVRPIWQELSSSGLRVFWSGESLKENIGQSFFSVIQEALEKSRYFLLYCTPAAMDSQWVKEEYETFYSNCYIPSQQKRRFVILPGLGFELQLLPPMLRRIQLTDSTTKIISILGGQDFQALKRENEELKRALETAQAESGERDAANKRVEALQAELDATSADLDTARKQIKNLKARPARQERAQETVQQQSAEAQAPELEAVQTGAPTSLRFFDKMPPLELKSLIRNLEELYVRKNKEALIEDAWRIVDAIRIWAKKPASKGGPRDQNALVNVTFDEIGFESSVNGLYKSDNGVFDLSTLLSSYCGMCIIPSGRRPLIYIHGTNTETDKHVFVAMAGTTDNDSALCR